MYFFVFQNLSWCIHDIAESHINIFKHYVTYINELNFLYIYGVFLQHPLVEISSLSFFTNVMLFIISIICNLRSSLFTSTIAQEFYQSHS